MVNRGVDGADAAIERYASGRLLALPPIFVARFQHIGREHIQISTEDHGLSSKRIVVALYAADATGLTSKSAIFVTVEVERCRRAPTCLPREAGAPGSVH
jgi:hypothetical protein